MMANNVGNLKVVATVDDAGRKLTAEAHLYATVQRFVDALIR
jgi:quinohemoprotein amine dehydrogenase